MMEPRVLVSGANWKRSVRWLYVGLIGVTVGFFLLFLQLSGPLALLPACFIWGGIAPAVLHFRAGWHVHARKVRENGIPPPRLSTLFPLQITAYLIWIAALAIPIIISNFSSMSSTNERILYSGPFFVVAIISVTLSYVLKMKEVDIYVRSSRA